jgi:endonuclease/exonuclease/phosphatase family metal-dependent hydrolase
MRGLGFETPTAKLGHTADFPMLRPRLDSIFVRGLNARGGAVERSVKISDHWPVWVDVEVPVVEVPVKE